MTSPQHNLPTQLTTFIGREREISDIARSLLSTRLLTLTGPGGAGKTRLSIEAACYSLADYPGGVWLVELADLTDPALVVLAVTDALGLREEADLSLLATLIERLEERATLLVLDNCEQLRRACASLVDTLLLDCPHLHVLATSRVALGVAGELVWNVPSMSFPNPSHLPPAREMERYEAIRLFVERVRLKQPDFAVSDENALAVAQLCYALDGMPLALELAAARTPMLGLEPIVAGLDERFRLLVSEDRATPTRRQTLKGAIDWSYDLLSGEAQSLFRQLSVFAGGFTLEAAEGVYVPDGDASEAIDILPELVEQSLVICGERGDGRYHMLDTIRQYAALKLKEADEVGVEDALNTRHAFWYLHLAEEADAHLQGPDQPIWFERLQSEHDNFRAALDWSLSSEGSINNTQYAVRNSQNPKSEIRHPQSADFGLRLAKALAWFWYARDYWTEGRRWLEAALEHSEGQPNGLRANAYFGAGVLARRQGDYADAIRLFMHSIDLFRELGDTRGVSATLSNLGVVATSQGDYARAITVLDESLAINRELGDQNGVSSTLNNLANIATDRGDYALARSYLEQSVAIQRKAGNKLLLATSLNNLGSIARYLGDYEQARLSVEESLSIRRSLENKTAIASSLNKLAEIEWCDSHYDEARLLCEEGLALLEGTGDREATALIWNTLGEIERCQGEYEKARLCYEAALAASTARWIVPDALYNLGRAAQQAGDLMHAAAALGESLQAYIQIDAKRGLAESLVAIAQLAAACNSPGQAARLFGAASVLLEATGYEMHPNDQEAFEASQREVRAQLGRSSWRRAWNKGRAVPQAVVAELAMQTVQSVLGGEDRGEMVSRSSTRVHKDSGDLTRRELEVLCLVVEGLTNQEIAARLFLSPNTVHAHLRSVYGKLDVATRSAAARYAVTHGLA